MFARRNNHYVRTRELDLSISDSLRDIGSFDNIVINHFRLGREQLVEIKNHITDNGVLFICGFGYKHKIDSRIRKEDLIQQNDFDDLDKFFELINYSENEDDRGFIVTYIFRRRNS
ncbi:hypothetical protein DEAC_c21940 [Desulfosporosinus acididurans]|uniref:Methyltransferase domain protein n=1 Tax=Desulfosporosinus acididurans TaxID=476652 RepID=A0A0J1FRP7_9FIRM|nr:hypothetical protein [Desulfosporosinus acididurans]KLU66155.1 hypothetical protein DEAC_c21940 [Desulfosporosinus acididurans]